jgi:hypothetical protein
MAKKKGTLIDFQLAQARAQKTHTLEWPSEPLDNNTVGHVKEKLERMGVLFGLEPKERPTRDPLQEQLDHLGQLIDNLPEDEGEDYDPKPTRAKSSRASSKKKEEAPRWMCLEELEQLSGAQYAAQMRWQRHHYTPEQERVFQDWEKHFFATRAEDYERIPDQHLAVEEWDELRHLAQVEFDRIKGQQENPAHNLYSYAQQDVIRAIMADILRVREEYARMNPLEQALHDIDNDPNLSAQEKLVAAAKAMRAWRGFHGRAEVVYGRAEETRTSKAFWLSFVRAFARAIFRKR